LNSRVIVPAITVACVVLLAWFVLPWDDPAPGNAPAPEMGDADVLRRLAEIEDELVREKEARIQIQAHYEEALSILTAVAPQGVVMSFGQDDGALRVDGDFGQLLAGNDGEGETIVVPVDEGNDARQVTPAPLRGRQLARARFEATMEGREREFLAEQLVVNGFSTEEAEHIAKRESELRLEALYADYEARRLEAERVQSRTNTQNSESTAGAPVTTERLSPNEQLRIELGDENYAKYLESSGRSTSVGVRSVMESSPAQMSGLQPGDEIQSYNGERVFSISEINEKTVEGMPGESILLEVQRNGEEVQIVIPRGPIGITTGRGR
jgi:hypothetical protein